MDKSRHSKGGGRDGVGVGGRLKQRLAQILLHSSCTTTSATAFICQANANAAAAAASSRHESPAASAHEPTPKIDRSGHQCRRRRSTPRRALVHISIDCSSGVGGGGTSSARRSARSVAPVLRPSPMPAKTRIVDGNKPRSRSYRCSSSTATDDELAPFSSDGDRAETRSSTLFSSFSFSSDSTSDFYNATGARTRSKRHRKPPRRAAPPRGSKAAGAFQPVQAAKPHDKDAKKADKDGGGGAGLAGSTAVVKRSHNPYADFRSSMVEMVVERRIRGADAMGELLVSYLSLNSRRHHPAILAAFESVWEAVLFGKDP